MRSSIRLFSSGVFLAMNSGELGAGVVDEALRNGDVSARRPAPL